MTAIFSKLEIPQTLAAGAGLGNTDQRVLDSFVNCGMADRGEVIDEMALVNALKRVRSAVLVWTFLTANLISIRHFLECKNAVLLPLLGSATFETRNAMGLRVMNNLDDFFSGKAPKDWVA